MSYWRLFRSSKLWYVLIDQIGATPLYSKWVNAKQAMIMHTFILVAMDGIKRMTSRILCICTLHLFTQ